MSSNLFQMLLHWEAENYGNNARDFNGSPLLASEIDWLNRYFGNQESLQKLHVRTERMFDTIESSSWYHFSSFVYQQVDKNQFSKICQQGLDFLEWTSLNYPELKSSAQMAKGALALGKKDMERLIKIFRHFNERQKTWIYMPSPTESLEEIQWNENFTALQIPESIELIQDVFQLISKNPEQQYGYFRGLTNEQAVVVKLDTKLCQLLQTGDQLPLSLSRSSEGHHFLNRVDYPTLSTSTWTK
jgi:hypothetical protein